MAGLGTSQLKFAVKVNERDLNIAHGHAWVEVAKHFHHSGETGACAEHFCAEGMSELVRNDAFGDAHGDHEIAPGSTQLLEESFAGTGTS